MPVARRAHLQCASRHASPARATALPNAPHPLPSGALDAHPTGWRGPGDAAVRGGLSTRDACALRLVCREFLAAVTAQPWEDRETVIKGSIAAWRACFPRARCANVRNDDENEAVEVRFAAVVDADFVHFEGLRELRMGFCRLVTDAAFAHLRGLHTLDMSWCTQAGITDAAFAHLAGIHTLNMSRCSQAGITDAAFAHLAGIHSLDMSNCRQAGITGAAFAHLRGIHTLVMHGCRQTGITDAAFEHLRGIVGLRMFNCRQAPITAALKLGLPAWPKVGL